MLREAAMYMVILHHCLLKGKNHSTSNWKIYRKSPNSSHFCIAKNLLFIHNQLFTKADTENKYPFILSYENGKNLFCCPWYKYVLKRLEKTNTVMMDPCSECQKQPALYNPIPVKDPERGHERREEPLSM